MNIKLLTGAFAVVALCAYADEIYVDMCNPLAADDTAVGRGGEGLPYATIEAAVEAAHIDDVIKVKPGVYESGSKLTPSTRQYNRVYLDKRLTLESTGGAAVTEIRGYFVSEESGYGNGAIRCVYVTAGGDGSVIRGFTIAKGATQNDSNAEDRGGGVRVKEGANAYLIDCAITNCWGKYGGAMYGGTAIRTKFLHNHTGSWDAGLVERANLWNCAVVEKNIGSGYRSHVAVTNVNCTYATADYLRPKDCLFYNCVLATYGTFTDDGGNTYSNTTTASANGSDQCFSPFLGDFRPLGGAAALGFGNTAYLRNIIAIPDALATTDFNGNTINYSSGTCNAGCVQGGGEVPQYGALKFTAGAAYVDGNYVPMNAPVRTLTYPKQFDVRHSTTAAGFFFIRDNTLPLVPTLSGECYATVPFDSAKTQSNWAPTPTVYWVDGENGSDGGNDGKEATPFQTIQKALDMVGSTKYGLIKVKPGTYRTGGATKDGVATRVAYSGSSGYAALVAAVEGPERTVIVGSADGVTEGRCVAGSGLNLQGFTLTGGLVTNSSVGAVAHSVNLFDCIVSNNTSATTLVNAGYVMRTRFISNTSTGSLYYGSGHAGFCAFHGNRSGGNLISGAGNPQLYNCTFTGNVTPGGTSLLGNNKVLPNNCIIDVNGGSFQKTTSTGMAPNYLNNFVPVDVTSNDAYIEADPGLSDAATGDERLYSTSPAIGSGLVGSSLAYMNIYYLYASGDIKGRANVFTAGGKTTMGCNQYDFVNGAVISATAGGLAVSGANLGANKVETGQSLTFTLSRDGAAPRNAIGFTVNGTTTNLFADLPGGQWSHTVSSAETSVSIETIYDNNWYVDAVNGLDSNDGFATATAKQTLAGVLTNAAIRAGDIVQALPGTYELGSAKDAADALTYSRAIIPGGVTLISTGGKDVTFIKGANSTGGGAADGCGSNATRCVFMNANTRLEGFTLTGGRTYHEWVSAIEKEYSGGGVYVAPGAGATALIVDCLFTDCKGGAGAAGVRGTYYRCRANSCCRSGGYSFGGATLLNCIVDKSPLGTATSACTIYNSVIVPAGGYTAVGDSTSKVYNSVVYGQNAAGANYYNCVMASNSTYDVWGGSTFFNAANCVHCVHTNIVALSLNADYMPQSAANTLLVDAGDNQYLPAETAESICDFLKAPRVMNRNVDIGAYEWDIRPELKAVLGNEVASVDWIASNVVENAGSVRLDGDGAKLEATVRVSGGGAASLTVPVVITGAGTLNVYINGVLAGSAESAVTSIRLASVANGDEVVMTFEGEGRADVGKLNSGKGFVITVR